MSDVDDAIERAEKKKRNVDSAIAATVAFQDTAILAIEVKRLRDLVVSQQAAMDQFMARIQHALKELEADDA
jgi:hypothetical protein